MVLRSDLNFSFANYFYHYLEFFFLSTQVGTILEIKYQLLYCSAVFFLLNASLASCLNTLCFQVYFLHIQEE